MRGGYAGRVGGRMSKCKFRWGVPEWDKASFTMIPNVVLKNYARVPWVGANGRRGTGISNQEAMFIFHLASFKWEAFWGGEPSPSIDTLRKRMGYAERKSITKLRKSLEYKGLLTVIERPGWTHVYDFSNFSQAIRSMQDV